MNLLRTHFILYVADQARSRRFYAEVLECEPTLDVPGMTEFALGAEHVLGLMPVAGIRRLLGETWPDGSAAPSGPRAELYLVVGDAARAHARALNAGARELSPLALREWGCDVAYALDPDGYVVAFAECGRVTNEST